MMKLFKYIFLTLITLLSYNSFSQTMPASGVATGASSGTWTVPANVYSIKIDAWGGGGAGAGQSTSGTGGLAGGAGGSRSTTTISVTPGQTIWFSIGAARAGTTGNAADGNDTWVSEVSNAAPTLSTDGVVAKGGKSAVGTTAGAGSNTGCVGTSNRGGSGRVGGATAGGGGSSAGTALNGVDATGTAGATAPAGGGNGGGGHASGGNGTAGSSPGGGGGGAYKNNTTSRTGGGGAAGRVILTYQAIPVCATVTAPANGSTNIATSQTLSWGSVSGATSYDVYFGTSATPTFIQNQAGTTYNPGTLSNSTTYYWKIVAKNAAGSALSCSTWSFTTKAPGCLTAGYGLYPSTTYTPACGGTVENITTTGYAGEYSNVSLTSGVQYTFSSSNATDYITIGNSVGTTVLAYGTTPVIWTSTLTGTVRFYTHTNDACTEAMVSRTRRVQCAVVPSCTTPVDPLNGATSQSIGEILTWNSVASATSYDVYFGTSATPPFVVNQTGTTYTPATLSYNTTYYWKIVPKNGAGPATGCSTWSFSTGGPGCLNAPYGQYPSTTYNPNCSGTSENITTTGYAGEYSVVNLISNVQYTLSSSVATDFITITDATGSTILAYGTGSLNYTPSVDGDIRFYLHTNESCGTAATGRSRRIQCSTPPPPSNDLVANAIDVGLCGGTFTGNTKFATQTGDAPSCYTGSLETWTAPGVWYKVVGNGQNITASLCGSTFDTKIFIYTGTAGSLTCLTYNDDFCSTQSEVTFASTLNTTYHILVTGYGSAKGGFSLNVSLADSPPVISTQPISGSVCAGQSRTFSVVASGNQGPLSYQWYLGGVAISGATSTSYVASTAGTYYVIVSNSCGATIQSSNATLTVNALPTITVSSPEICNGFSTQIVAGGGTSYVWSTGATTSTISVSPTSTTNYTVTGTDANGCQSQATSTVTVNPNPQVSLNSTSSTICAGGSGTNNIIATASSGTSTYTYQWQYWNGTSWLNTGTNTNTLNATPTVTREYRVIVSDVKGCQVTYSSHTVTVVPDPINPTLNTKTPNQTDVCAGTNLSATFNPGTDGVSCGDVYQFSTNGTTWSTYTPGNTISTSSLTQGTTVQIRGRRTNCAASIGCSANGWDVLASWSIVTPPTLSNSVTNVSCNGGTNGAINLTVSGSTPPYSYSWTGPNGFTASTEDLTGLSSGSYTVNVSVPSGCVSSSTITITQPSLLQSSLTKTDINCFGNSTGSINLTPTGGTTPYTFSWSNGATTEDISLLSAGNYSVTITDANGCQTTNSVAISQPAAALGSSSTQQNVLCNGGAGSIDLSVSGGTSPYTYSWSNGQTTQDISNVIAGTYSVTVTDSKSCQTTRTITITQPSALSLSSTSTNVSCNGGSNGSIDLSVSGGTSPYTYLWSNSATTQDLTNITSGTYSVTVTDANGCQSTRTVTITQPISLSTSFTSTNVNCFSSSTGSIDLSVSGGISPYTYSWSNGQTTQDLTNIAASNYSVTVTDANGCQTTTSVTITEPTQLTSTFTQVNVSCNGGSNGSIDLSVSGGTSPYTFNWSNGQTTEDLSGLSSGNYTVTITDVNGCQTTNSVTITQPSVLSSTSTQFSPSCFGATNGSINLTPTGGTSPYTFLWSNGATTEDIFSLSANTYSVTITDSKGCQATRTVTITQPTQLTTTVTTTNIDCYGNNTGSASVVASGGTPPYLYMWNTGNTQSSIYNLASGNYQITVTDNKGCTKINNLTITQPSALSISLSITAYPFCGSSNGSVSGSVIGGTPPYTYSWSNGSTSQNLTNVAAGNYTLTVTDSKGCQSQSGMTLGCTSAVIVVGQISGPTSVCGLNTATYSINYSNAAPDNISWILPNGLSSTNGLNNQNVNVVFSSGFVADSIEVDVLSNGITYHRSMWISKLPNKPIVSGNFCGDPVGSIRQYVVTNSQSNTTYNWNQPYGVNILSGQGNDTTQFKFSSYFVGGSSAQVTATNSCGSSSTQFTIDKLVVRPTAILGPTSVCADGVTIYTYRVDSVPTSFMYMWAVPNGVTVVGSTTNDTLKVKFSTNFTSGQFSVMSVNKCGSSPMTYGTVSNNNLYANIGTITGPGDLCPYLGQTTTYSVSPQSGVFTWSVPSGLTIQSGQGTNVLTVFVSNTFTSGNISVSLNNGCGGSISSSKSLSTTQSSITATPIQGPSSVCSLIGTNTPATYSISPISGVNYNWTVPANATIVSGQGTNSINVTFQNGFSGGNIQVTVTAGCGNPVTMTRLINLNLPTFSISGVNCVDNGYTNTYSTSVTGALSYNWTVPGNAQITSGQGTSSISVFFPGNFETTSCVNNSCDSIRLTVQFACGSVTKARRVGLLTVAPNVTGPSQACFPDTITLTASTSPRITSYIWNSPNGVSFVGPTTNVTAKAKINSTFLGGSFSVMGVNTCGSSPMRYFFVNKVCPAPSALIINDNSDVTQAQNVVTTIDELLNDPEYVESLKKPIDFIVYPNPGRTKINLRVFKGNSDYYLVQIHNLIGQNIYLSLHESEDIIDVSKLEAGIFLITIEGKDGYKLTKQLVIEK